MKTGRDMQACRPERGPLRRRLAAVVLRLRRASPRRCEVRPDWMDEGPAPVREPRRPLRPSLGGAVALELPPGETLRPGA
ncbi:MAG TPA: hypothetical protein VKD47_09295 [Miltoncostaeaceae bacterium]|nr:hypothetical protein [Miltoncostaeaceae bacterium]